MKLIRENCLTEMKKLDSESIDMILCDLPYGTTRNKWDSAIDLNELLYQYERVIKNNGAIVLFSQMPFTAQLVYSNLELFKYEWIWEKQQGTGHLNAKKMPLKIHENICVFYKKPPVYNPQMRNGFKPYICTSGHGSSNYGKQTATTTVSNGERYPIDILRFSYDKNKFHPTQKPVALLEYLIKTYTNEGDTILDNCMGSGSTGVACVNTDRDFIGIEIESTYFEIAKQRIEDAIQQKTE